MTRIFAIVGAAWFFTLFILINAKTDLSLRFIAVSVAIFALSLLFKKTRKYGLVPILALSVLLSSAGFLITTQTAVKPVQKTDDKGTFTVTATLVDLPEYGKNSIVYTFKTKSESSFA